MRFTPLLFLAALVVAVFPASAQRTPTVDENPALVQQYMNQITQEGAAGHFFFLASDWLEGREATARGQRISALYIASHFQRMGLQPKGTLEGNHPLSLDRYLQPFPLYGQRTRNVTVTARRANQVMHEAFYGHRNSGDIALLMGGMPEVEGEAVFVGYGIQETSANWDDYAAARTAGIDFTGKWVVMLEGEPRDAQGRSRVSADGSTSGWTNQPVRKLRAAMAQGAVRGIILIAQEDDAAFAGRVARLSEALNTTIGGLSLTPPTQGGGRVVPPVLAVSQSFGNQLLQATGETAAQMRAPTASAVAQRLPDVHLHMTMEREVFTAMNENVLGYLEGSDPELKDEVVVVLAHYDHVAMVRQGDTLLVNNGADDNGSGTVGVLEVAEAFTRAARDGHAPRRSILFLAVSAEEKGLIGAQYYTDYEPVIPLERIVTAFNADMIGRRDPDYNGPSADNYIYLIGSYLISQELHDLTVRVNRLTGLNMDLNERYNSPDDPNRFYRRSDHWHFGKNNIPFIFFFNGVHEDYHQPTDTADRIDYPQFVNRARLIFSTTWQVANQDNRPAISGAGFN